MADEAGKIHIDDDWKSEAAAEKARLAADFEPKGATAPQAEPGFLEVVQLIATQAVVGLGGMSGPAGQEIPPSLDVAKHFIDLLEAIEIKTRGNLTAEEKRVLDTTLHQLRMAYVESVRGPASSGPPDA